MRCTKCNNKYDDDLKRCPECGKPNRSYNRDDDDNGDHDNGGNGDDGGGILGQLGDLVGKLFGG